MPADPGDEWIDQSEWVDDVGAAEAVGEGAPEYVGHRTVNEPAGAVATMPPATEPEGTPKAATADPSSDHPHTELVEPRPVSASPPPERRIGIAAIAFGAAIALLAASIPVLTWVGYRLAISSRAGVINNAAEGPGAGASQVLPPTPTELVAFTDSRGHPASYSLLSLNNGAHGGAVVSIPAKTKLPHPGFGLTRLDVAYAFGGLRTLRDSFTTIVDSIVGGDVRIGPTQAAALVSSLGGLAIDNPVEVGGRGGLFPSGPLQLRPGDVMSYLAATNSADPLAQMKTQQAFWRAWLAAIAHDPSAAKAATNFDSRLGNLVHTLATGGVNYDTLPVKAEAQSNGGSTDVFTVDQGAARLQLLAAVPFPMAPIDVRPQVELYNGYDNQGVPPAIMQRVVFAGGQLLLVGTAGNPGRNTTELHYGDPSMVPEVDQIRAALGAGKLVLDPTIAEPGDVTIICGKDVIKHPPKALVGAG